MPEQRSGWSGEFDEPIAVPDGGTLVTLRDAADYITALPDGRSALPEWQAAIEALMLVSRPLILWFYAGFLLHQCFFSALRRSDR
jgi:hypothetical protein